MQSVVVLVVMETKRLSLNPGVPLSPLSEPGALRRTAEPYTPFDISLHVSGPLQSEPKGVPASIPNTGTKSSGRV